MKSLMLGLSMLGLFSLTPAFSAGNDKDCCKKKSNCTEAEKAKCAEDNKKCLDLCKKGNFEPGSKECKEACEKAKAAEGTSASAKKSSCCKK